MSLSLLPTVLKPCEVCRDRGSYATCLCATQCCVILKDVIITLLSSHKITFALKSNLWRWASNDDIASSSSRLIDTFGSWVLPYHKFSRFRKKTNRATVPYTYRCDLLGIENCSRETSRNREVLSISFSESRTLSRILSRLRFFLEKSPRSRSFITVANSNIQTGGTRCNTS